MTHDDIPRAAAPLPPVTDAATLHRTWRRLMGRLGFRERALWMLLIAGDGRPVHGVQLGEAPRVFEHDIADNLMSVVRELSHDGISVAFLYSRPGPGPCSADDMTWVTGLSHHLRRCGLPLWPVHLANDTDLTTVAPDELVPG